MAAKPLPANVKCPTCTSSNVKRIGAGEKAAKGLGFGILAAGTLTKSIKCLDCGFKW